MAEAITTTARRAIPLRSRIAAHRVINRVRRIGARVVHFIPGTWQTLGVPRGKIRSLKAWIEHARESYDWLLRCKGPTYELISEPEVVVRRAPKTVHPGATDHGFSLERYHLHNETYLARIPGARILGPGAIVITPDGCALEESTWGESWLDKDRAMTSWKLPKPEMLTGSYYTIACLSSVGYWHWLLEALPRLYALERLAVDETRVIVSNRLNDWQIETLDILGFGNLEFIPISNRYLELEFLYFPSYIGTPGNPQRWNCQWLRDRFLKDIEPGRNKRRFYITRRAAGRRRVTNESELEPILERFGFEIIETENLSMREKVRMFSEAEMIAGPHGAGLTNILFAPAGCKVLEMFDPQHIKVNYYAESDALDQEYWYLIGQAAGASNLVHGISGHGDIYVSIDDFTNTLSKMLET
jgi:capsular polysaccharide biosynthesis protein